eukprot:Ihof_evm5s14 gene=Ihof_evmTU5s14
MEGLTITSSNSKPNIGRKIESPQPSDQSDLRKFGQSVASPPRDILANGVGQGPPHTDRNQPRQGRVESPGSAEGSEFPLEVDDLKLLGVIGRGSSGIVQKALHVPTGRIFALKGIHLDVSDIACKQIMLELRTLYWAQSKYIVKFYGAYLSEGSINIALEYMDGGSLSDVIAKAGPIPEPLLGLIASQVLLGLLYLHKERHLIHRDIKPSNLLISTAGQVKITDFGVSGEVASTISSLVSWVGTVTYMS